MTHNGSDEEQPDLTEAARALLDGNAYMTLATAGADGRPWATPVWYAHDSYTDYLWVSRENTRHSRNLADRPEVSIVIFDSTVPVGSAQAVYIEATAEELDGHERDQAVAVYSRRSEAGGIRAWRTADVAPPAALRLYRARALHHFILDANERRVPVDPASAANSQGLSS